MPYKDIIKKREQNRRWYWKNHDKVIASYNKNKEKYKEKRHQWYENWYKNHGVEYQENKRNQYLEKKYGLTTDQKRKLCEDSNWECKICHKKVETLRKAHIDHDHKTGKIRGILCSKCNLGLGMFDDSINYLKSAIIYLEQQ
jgi:hypothetical protein